MGGASGPLKTSRDRWAELLRGERPYGSLGSGEESQRLRHGEWIADGPVGKVKVRFAKRNAFGAGSRVLILDEPTRGVDVQAKTEIHALIDELAEAPTASC